MVPTAWKPWISSLMLLWMSCLGLAAQTTTYEVNADNALLTDVLLELEDRYQWRFSYADEQVAGIRVSIDISTTAQERLLIALLQETPLTYQIIEEQYIGLRTRADNTPPTQQLCGRVIDSLTQQPLAFAYLQLLRNGVGTTTNAEGYFSLTTNAWVQDQLIVSYVGYTDFMITVQELNDVNCPSIPLSLSTQLQNLIIVTDYLGDGVRLSEQGTNTEVNLQQLGSLPGQVEPDIGATLRALPGISTPDGTLSNLYLRGSTPDHNLMLWEGIPLYHTGHYFGSIGVLNAYTVDKLNVHRGGFGAEYGGRIAGLIDMQSDVLTPRAQTTGAGLNGLTAFGYGQVNSGNGKLGLRVSARRSLFDYWQTPFFQELRYRQQQALLRGPFSPRNLPRGLTVLDTAGFVDVQLQAAAQLSKRDQLKVAYLQGRNSYSNYVVDSNVNREHNDKLVITQSGASASWQRQWSPAWGSTLAAQVIDYTYDYDYTVRLGSNIANGQEGKRQNDLRQYQWQWRNTVKTSGRWQWGYELNRSQLGYTVVDNADSTQLADQAGATSTLLHTVYGNYRSQLAAKTGYEFGVRSNYYDRTNQLYWEPRLQLWYRPNERWLLQLHAGRYQQFLSQLTEFKGSQTAISQPIWLLADGGKVPVLQSTQLQLGGVYHHNDWVVDVQLYAKRSTGLSGIAIGFVPRPMTGFDLGEAQVRGMDVLVKKQWGPWRAWWSYTLSRVNYVFSTFFDPVFAAPFDQRHRTYWAGSYQQKGWRYSLAWRWQSGLPYSWLQRFEVIERPNRSPTVRPLYDAYNAERLPAQHQLDAAITYHWELGTNMRSWRVVAGLALNNVYDHQNLFARDYFLDIRPMQPIRIVEEDQQDVGITVQWVLRVEW